MSIPLPPNLRPVLTVPLPPDHPYHAWPPEQQQRFIHRLGQVKYEQRLRQAKAQLEDPSYQARVYMRNHRAEFCQTSLSIHDKRGKLVPYQWNPAQDRLNALIDSLRVQRKPVRIVILKTRRSGFSTGVAGRFFPETAFDPGQNTLIVAHELKSVEDALYPMYHRFQRYYKPFRLFNEKGRIASELKLPKLSSESQKGLRWINESGIHIATANNLEGARSFGYRKVHFSESAFYRDFRTLMTAVMQTVPNDADTSVIIESTANGVGGHFYDICQSAMAGQSEWAFLFFGCYDDPENTLLLEQPAHVFQASLTDREQELRQQFNLTLEQLNWRRYKIRNDFFGDEAKFNQEYPATPEIAFLVSGRPQFDHESINRYVAQVGEVGDLAPVMVGQEQRLIFSAHPTGFLEVWKRPQPGREYVMGCDTAEGIDRSDGGSSDPDFSCSQVLDRDTGEQVARLRGRMYEYLFGEYNARLAAWYNFAFVVPEVMRGFGRAMLDAMLGKNYPIGRIYSRRNPADSITKPHLARYDDLGWETTTVTRPQLISAIGLVLIEHSVTLKDSITIQELRTMTINKHGKGEAQSGCHDDSVIALGLAIIGLSVAPRFSRGEDAARQPNPYGPDRYAVPMRERLMAERNSVESQFAPSFEKRYVPGLPTQMWIHHNDSDKRR